jgi:hypothetical protein
MIMSTLSDFQTAIAALLDDPAHALYPLDALNEAIRDALQEISLAAPQSLESVLTLTSSGWEIDLSALPGLLSVSEVWWPYDPALTSLGLVRGFHLRWNGAAPLLFLHRGSREACLPAVGDQVRIWYAARHTIQGLDGAAMTSLSAEVGSLLARGAAGMAVFTRLISLLETRQTDPRLAAALAEWGERKLASFRAGLETLRGQSARGGPAWAELASRP